MPKNDKKTDPVVAMQDEVASNEDAINSKANELVVEEEARRRAQANRGVTRTNSGVDMFRNPTGTFSEPTPTDVRYPNKLTTEFENNLGAYVGRNAADMRRQYEMPDAPGGLAPQEDATPGNVTPPDLDSPDAQIDRNRGPSSRSVEFAEQKAGEQKKARRSAKSGDVSKEGEQTEGDRAAGGDLGRKAATVGDVGAQNKTFAKAK
jgi:hypothetical protein